LISNYCYFVDSGEFDRFVDLFTEDSVWDAGESFGRYEGKAALRAFISQTPPGLRHLTLNTVITLDGDDARAKSYIVLLNSTDNAAASIAMTAFYEDHIVKRGGRWLFKSRIVHSTPLKSR
jgi:hypothetical protein